MRNALCGCVTVVLLLACCSEVHCQQQDSAEVSVEVPRPFWLPAAGGVVGSGVGMVAGTLVGGVTADCDHPDAGAGFCGLGEAVIGLAVGSAFGSAAGSYSGSRLAGGRPSILRTIVGGVAGVAVGIGVGMVADQLVEADVAGFIGYSIGQGVTAGVAAGAWR